MGIVTRYDLFAFKSGDIWGGVVVYPNSTTSKVIPAFIDFNNNIAKDEYASLISFWQYTSESDETTVINAYEYTKPVAYPPPFAELQRIPGKIADTTRITNLTDLTAELVQAYGFRSALHFARIREFLIADDGVSAMGFGPSRSPTTHECFGKPLTF